MKHLVISVHGIRTFGGWQERLETLLLELANSNGEELTVKNYRFGYFSALAFVVPFLRWLVVRQFRKFFVHEATSQQWDRIDLVGHSFGTHIIAWALHGIDAAARPSVNTILLAGSVLKSSFPWQVLIGRCVKRVVNDCGTGDSVLILNQITILGTGMAGRLGFNGGIGQTFRNRFFDCGHSGYFLTAGVPDDTFMKTYWLPLLMSNAAPIPVDMRKADALSGAKLWLLNNMEPIKLAVYFAPLLALVLYFYSLKSTAETQLHRADANFNITHKLLSDHLEAVSETVRLFTQVETLDALISKTTALMKLVPQGDDRRVRLERARASIILGEVKWERGKTREMYDLANEAIKAMGDLPDDKDIPEDQRLEAQHLLARGTGLLGLFYSASTTGSDPQKSLEHNERALSLLAQLEKRFDELSAVDTQWRWLRSLAKLQHDRGDLLLTRDGQVEQANDYYGKSAATWQKLKRSRPNDTEIDFALAWAQNKVGDVMRDQGHAKVALTYFEEAADRVGRLGDELSTHPKWREALSITQNNIGLILREQGKYADAIKSFEQAKNGINRILAHDRGQKNWHSVLAWTNDNLGETRLRWARANMDVSLLAGAKDELTQAHRTRLELKDEPVARWRLAHLISEANLAALAGTEKQFERRCLDAARSFQHAAMKNPELTGDEGDDAMVLRVVEFHEWATLSFRNAGRMEDAERELKKAVGIISRYSPKFVAKRATFAATKARLEERLGDATVPDRAGCVDQ